MHKEESDNKMNEKNSPENTNMNQKVKLTKEKKISQKSSVTPKKAKKKVQIYTAKEKEKDTSQKSNIIKSKGPPLVEEKNEKMEKTNIIPVNNREQKINVEEAQNASPNIKENKEKRNWKSWSPQEKFLFYEIIANGGNYSSLQKLFKTMNDVSISIK
jgi:hypothetical protein